ncbi:hypothetical protein I317_03488 [Kwoniella heveanensis CBS 569]|nr:hypothetical protein I317_03488 [Kwoniella heveanensis CBS 569]
MPINISRSSPRALFLYLAAAVSLYLLLNRMNVGVDLASSFSGGSSGNTRDLGIRSTDTETQRFLQFKQTRVLNHAAGYTVVENLYWHNYSYVFVTDQPWAIPQPLDRIANTHVDTRIPLHGHEEIKIMAIRNHPVSPEVQEIHQLGNSVTFEEAIDLVRDAEELPSPMFINNDDNFVSHFYHWIGEMFLGSWRLWSNLAWRTGAVLPNIKVVAFTKQYGRAEAPWGTNGGQWWEDAPGANKWFTEKFFPGVVIESRPTWEARAQTGKYYHIPMAVIADRRGGHNGPSTAWKPYGDVLRLPTSPDWLVNLRERVLKGYTGSVKLRRVNKPKVMYLERQNSGRELVPEDHEELWKQILKLEEDGLAEVSMETFSSAVPFEDQVALISTVDYLVSVHGNGLTHTLWLDPGASVFEIQPAECTITDYSPLAIAAGVQHYMIHETSFCVPEKCGKRTCPGKWGINRSDIRVTATVITDQIRKLIGEKNRI